MQIRIRPPHKFSQHEIDLGRLEFPARWIQIPLPKNPKAQKDQMCAKQGEDWCGENEIHAELGSQYKYDRAVWAVTIIDSLLFDCDSGQVVVDFIQETEEADCALVPMNTRLLEDLKRLIDGYYKLPDDTDSVKALYKTMLSFCIDVYSTYVLHELKHMGCIPPNYFIWIAQIKRKDLAREICFKTKEIGDLLYTGFGERMDPELADWVTHCIEETSKDLLDFVLRNNSRLFRDTFSSDSSPETILEISSDGPPSTPNSHRSDLSSEASDGSPTPAHDIDLFEQYRDRFDLTGDTLRHVDPKRMAKLLPPKLSRRGLGIDEVVKDHLDELEDHIATFMNDVRKLEKLIEDEEKKERDIRQSHLPSAERCELAEESTDYRSTGALSASKAYNLRARRASTPPPGSYGKKPKKNKNFQKSLCKSALKRGSKRVKTPEEYDEEWKRRQDSPYPRRHSEIITGKSATQMMLSGSLEQAKKRKLEIMRERSDLSPSKKLKITIKLARHYSARNDNEDDLSDVDDERDDPDWSEGNERKKKKKNDRSGKALGYRRSTVGEQADSIPPSTAEYLQSLRAPISPPIGSRQMSQREIQALSLHARNADRSSTISRSPRPSASSSTSMVVDAKEDGEPGWEIKTRTPLSSKSLSHASSKSNAHTSQTIPSRRATSNRPPLRRENSGIHPNAYYVVLPTNFDPSFVFSLNGSSTNSDIPVPSPADELITARSEGDNVPLSEHDEISEEDYNFELGILSPEEKRKLAKEAEERPIRDETYPEIDELQSSPEETEDTHDCEKSFTESNEMGIVQDIGESEDDIEIDSDSGSDASGESDEGDDEEIDELLSDEEAEVNQGGQAIYAENITRPAFRWPIEPPSELFDDEAEAEEARDADAALLRLHRSISIDLDNSINEESKEDALSVQELLEDRGFIVHRPGTPRLRKAVIFPTNPLGGDSKGGKKQDHEPRKLKKRNRKDGKAQKAGAASKVRALSGIMANLRVGFSKSSSITLLKPELSSSETTTPPISALPSMCQATSSMLEKVEHRPVTKVYPNRRGKATNKHTSPRSNVNNSYETGASIPRPNSPYRNPSATSPVGIHMFLNGFLRDDIEEDPKNNERTDHLNRHAEQAPERDKITGSDSKETTNHLKSPLKNDTKMQTPLSPVKGIKQKRYPGMLLSPEQKPKENQV